ncbi:hypothetical protein ABPG77_004952 [Micractinium sp. CCAP 211/92]
MMMASVRLSGARPVSASSSGSRQRSRLVVRADNRPLREYNEESGQVKASGSSGSAEAGKEDPPKFLYADENPPPPRDTMSPEMKARLRKEYYGLGGAPNQKMGNNYFLIIILVISALAVASKLTGAI